MLLSKEIDIIQFQLEMKQQNIAVYINENDDINMETRRIMLNRMNSANINKMLDNFASQSTSSKTINVYNIGESYKKKPIKMLCIFNQQFSNQHPNTLTFIESGTHGNELIGVDTTVYIINELINNPNNYTSTIDWCMVPLVNPDGYDESIKIKWHRKNMNYEGCNKFMCNCGVDLNRNFDFMFGFTESSLDQCSEQYMGAHGNSENETRALLRGVEKFVKRINLYISLHSYGSLIMYSWGYKKEKCADWEELEKAGKHAVKEMEKVLPNSSFVVGCTSLILYPASGGSDDYIRAKYGIRFIYTFELQQGSHPSSPFIPEANEIPIFTQQNMAGILALAAYVDKYYETHNRENIPYSSNPDDFYTGRMLYSSHMQNNSFSVLIITVISILLLLHIN